MASRSAQVSRPGGPLEIVEREIPEPHVNIVGILLALYSLLPNKL